MENGKLPPSALQAIPFGRLAKGDPARSWLAMRYFIGRRKNLWIRPGGPNSSYRTYQKQVEFYNAYRNGSGPLAARPGTSNHGWGRAVDAADPQYQAAIRTVGHLFGWGIQGGQLSSDAMSESWHCTFVKMTPKARYWYARYRLARRKKK
ncbi:Peptidase M15B [uncultured Caudovirales phage]|uniref:Peptidase M15B n=1 Tax=uncultured Caudovirales phage TaxID=2100421 RepID=A0A6J5RUA7_9CAUD|nr:Peptidase M15B [uncultured Caudovirales phage]